MSGSEVEIRLENLEKYRGAAPGFFTQCDGDKQSSAEDLGHGMSDILMRHPASVWSYRQVPGLDRLQWSASATIQPPTSPAWPACLMSFVRGHTGDV